MPFNAPLANRVIKIIEKHPELHNQGEWRCETGMCFAGWTSQLSGVKWCNDTVGDDSSMYGDSQVFDPETGEVAYVSTVAQKLLGLSEQDRGVLFSSSRTAEELKAAVQILSEPDYVPNTLHDRLFEDADAPFRQVWWLL